MLKNNPLILVLLLNLLGVACSQSGKPDTTVSSSTEGGETETYPTLVAKNLVEQIEIQLLESFPAQANVIVRGQLSNSCEKINQIMTEQEKNVFTVEMTTLNQASANCQAGSTPFQQIIPLMIDGLRAGIYTVTVNGVSDTFELAVDNIVRWE